MPKSSTLQTALAQYRAALLETASGDLFARKAGLPQSADGARAVLEARTAVMAAARNLSNDQFVAEVMAAGFNHTGA
jgi:hypothetical protein